MKTRNVVQVALLLGASAVMGWTRTATADNPPTNKAEAVAIIQGAGDNKDKIKGEAAFIPESEGIKIIVDVTGLTPGKHGIHVHQKADLSAPDLSSAGPHFNPGGPSHHHGGPDDPTRHAGDLGNIEVDENGHGHLELMSNALSIDDPKTGVIGHSIIIHAKPDDLKTDPAGNSGARIAGGAIVLRNAGGRQPGSEK
ncbi:MAG TPA: superoxide dismutase family protein [Tepidisphaeraceae bacterium]